MKRGRKPKPTSLKLLQGNPGKRPIERDPVAPETKIPPSRKEFMRVAAELYKLKMMSEVSMAALAVYTARPPISELCDPSGVIPRTARPSVTPGLGEEPAGRPIPEHRDSLLVTREAAFLLGLSHRTLEALRLRGGGPPFVKVTSRAVRYRRFDIEAFIVARRRASTSDPGPAANKPAALDQA